MTSPFQTSAFILTLALLWTPSTWAQLVRDGSAAAALGRPVVLRGVGPDASNPSALSHARGFALLLHAARPYHLEGLHVARFSFGLGGGGRGGGLSLERLGYADFAQTTIGIAGAIGVDVGAATTVSVGARGSAIRAAPLGYPAQRAYALDVGWTVAIDSAVTAGAVVEGLGRGGHVGPMAPSLSVGAAWHASPALDLFAHALRQSGHPLQHGIGVQIRLHDAFVVRTGITTEPVQLCGGIGLQRGRLYVDVAVVSHPVLGLSSSLTLGVRGDDP